MSDGYTRVRSRAFKLERTVEDKFGRLVEQIYHSGLDPNGWNGVAASLQELYPSARISLNGHDLRTNINLGIIHAGYESSFMNSYIEHYSMLNPWVNGFLTAGVGVTHEAERLCSPELLKATEFYHDWLKPQEKIATGAAVILHRDPNRLLALCANIPVADEERLKSNLVADLTRLTPHIQRAFVAQRHVRLMSAGSTLRAFEAVDESAGLFVIGFNSTVLSTNDIAEDFIQCGVVRVSAGNKLICNDDSVNDYISHISDLRFNGNRPEGIGFSISNGNKQFILYVYPVSPPSDVGLDWVSDIGWPRYTVTIKELDGEKRTEADLAMNIFGFTQAERDLANLICKGFSLDEISEINQVTKNTLKSQMRSILRKCGARRQSDVIRIIMGLR